MIRKRAGTDILFSNVQHLKTATFDQMGTLMEQNLCLMGSFTVISAPKIPSPAHAYIPADYVGNFHFGIPPSQPPTDFPLFLPSSLNAHSKGIDFILTRLVIPPHSTPLILLFNLGKNFEDRIELRNPSTVARLNDREGQSNQSDWAFVLVLNEMPP